ncbi:MAG: 23S rRNA (uracil(1939)-C(5))-methyltransferase RlmD [Blautia sp.]|nr:23S rRNA (uracil(1939)-C(5))-methyltransferase RlmD [Blautia sp.]
MGYQKNDLVELTIEDYGVDGEGIGKIDGFTVFVKDTCLGDRIVARIVKAKKNYGYGRLEKLLQPSPDRAEPLCPCARQCGGCQLQALSYEKQLAFKENKVRMNLQRIGGFTEFHMEPIIGAEQPYHYRNKAQFPVGKSKDGRTITGFYAGRTHFIVENRDCVLGIPENRRILDTVLCHMEKYRIEPYDEEKKEGLVRHVLIRYGFATKEIMVCLVLNGDRIPGAEKLCKALLQIPGMKSICINVNRQPGNVILGDQVVSLYGNLYIEDCISSIRYRISPLSFYQVNSYQTEKLYRKALEYADLHDDEVVWDLYCGIGTISLFLARNCRKVYGVEIVPAAVENARTNALLNHIANAQFYVGKAEEVLPERYQITREGADVIVVDPPRKGCDEVLLQTMIRMAPSRIVYVSCDSATLARDLKYLCENGYKLEKVCPVDQFPQTVHVESCVLLERVSTRKADSDEEDMINDISGNAAADLEEEESWSLKYGKIYSERTEIADGFRSLIDDVGSRFVPDRNIMEIYERQADE